MFKRISIRNFITFKKIEIDFEKGFTVFTGETGAGKSLLIDALMLVLGYRADTKFIRKNEDHTEIIAEFELEKKSVETNSLYQQFIFEDDGHFILLLKITYQVQDLSLSSNINSCSWLICNKERWVACQSHTNHGTLP